MTVPPLTLTGTLRQSEAEDLRRQAIGQVGTGALVVATEGLEAIEVGPLQVLLCAAAQARRHGFPCRLEGGGASAIDACLASLRLPEAAHFFTLVPPTEVSIEQ